MLSNNCIFPPALIAPFPPQDRSRPTPSARNGALLIGRPDIPKFRIQILRTSDHRRLNGHPRTVHVLVLRILSFRIRILDWNLIQLTAGRSWLSVLVRSRFPWTCSPSLRTAVLHRAVLKVTVNMQTEHFAVSAGKMRVHLNHSLVFAIAVSYSGNY